jgi:hypothetical protein
MATLLWYVTNNARTEIPVNAVGFSSASQVGSPAGSVVAHAGDGSKSNGHEGRNGRNDHTPGHGTD